MPVEQDTIERWRETFARIQKEREQAGEKVVWVMVDGFLLYWDKVCPNDPPLNLLEGFNSLRLQDVIDTLDTRVFLRVPHDVLKQRRHERHGYHTAGKDRTSFALEPTFRFRVPNFAHPPLGIPAINTFLMSTFLSLLHSLSPS